MEEAEGWRRAGPAWGAGGILLQTPSTGGGGAGGGGGGGGGAGGRPHVEPACCCITLDSDRLMWQVTRLEMKAMLIVF